MINMEQCWMKIKTSTKTKDEEVLQKGKSNKERMV
jgi:hypothetical protein